MLANVRSRSVSRTDSGGPEYDERPAMAGRSPLGTIIQPAQADLGGALSIPSLGGYVRDYP